MRTPFTAAAVAFSVLASLAVACTSPTDEEVDGTEDAVGSKNLVGTDFSLKPKEIALTLDDGPGPRTVELAEFLVRENVPATFFMVGKNAEARAPSVKRVAELSAEAGGLFEIGNHSMTHTTALPQQGVVGATSEIVRADAILAPNMEIARGPLPAARPFFRPPYGAFKSLGVEAIARVNAGGAEKYVGPVFWDIGGELTDTHSADWACWGKVSIERCADGYIKETQARGRGIILAHDVHSKTVDMLMGTGAANGRSLIKELRAQGFTFVSLRGAAPAAAR